MPTVYTVLGKINEVILNPLIVFMFVLALVVFLWGVFEFLQGSDDPEKRKVGGNHILWGVIGMAIMISVFAIIRIILGTFGIPIPPGV